MSRQRWDAVERARLRRLQDSNYVVYVDGNPTPLPPAEALQELRSLPAVFLRGLPGVGKTTFARRVYRGWKRFEADQFMVDDEGTYAFQQERVGDCHDACAGALWQYLETHVCWQVVVANTFSRHWEMQTMYMMTTDPYLEVPLIVHLHPGALSDAELAARTVHVVPEVVIASIRHRWEPWPGEIVVSQGPLSPAALETYCATWKPWPGLHNLR